MPTCHAIELVLRNVGGRHGKMAVRMVSSTRPAQVPLVPSVAGWGLLQKLPQACAGVSGKAAAKLRLTHGHVERSQLPNREPKLAREARPSQAPAIDAVSARRVRRASQQTRRADAVRRHSL